MDRSGSRVEEPVLTILVDDVIGPADADTVRSAQPARWPPLDLFESWRSFLIRVDVPGIKAGDLEVTFAGGLLVVRGARYLAAGPEGERFHQLERPAGSFRRAVALPTAATPEMVEASVEDGVLTVVIPKLAPAAPNVVTLGPTALELDGQPHPAGQDVGHPQQLAPAGLGVLGQVGTRTQGEASVSSTTPSGPPSSLTSTPLSGS